MPQIEISEKLESAFYSAAPAAWALAKDLSSKRSPYEGVSLGVDLSQFRLPDAGTVQIAIDFTASNAVGVPPYQFDVHVASRHADHLFPRFEGQMQLQDESGQSTWMRLRGRYEPPMGRIGSIIDRSLFHNIAGTSLHAFLHWFAQETKVRIERGNFQTADQMMHQIDG